MPVVTASSAFTITCDLVHTTVARSARILAPPIRLALFRDA